MIVKNEEHCLARCLDSVQGAVDEICIVDTGSTDETANIARAYGAKVRHVPWNGRFDDARNASLDMATSDWVFVLDADERLVSLHGQKIRHLSQMAPPQMQAAFFFCISSTPDGTDESAVLRMFRRLPHIRFEGRIHEEVGLTVQRAGGHIAQTPITFIHEGYTQKFVDLKDKWVRNEAMLLQEDEERPGLVMSQYNLGHHFLIKGDKERAKPYLEKALQLADPSHLFYGRLIVEAQMTGILVGGVPNVHLWPADPMRMGLAPDPLERKAS